MRWIIKAVAQRAIGALPRSEDVNYLFQRHVTKSLPRNDDDFLNHARHTIDHYKTFLGHEARAKSGDAHFYEFGAGWDLITPLLYRALGVGHQTLVDIRPNLRYEVIEHTLHQLESHRASLEREAGQALDLSFGPVPSSLADLERLGIRYLAPCDARSTGLAAASFDFASSTFTLEHIPPADIALILGETRRLLRPGAVTSSSIDMQDHYSFMDLSISVYNYLKFSDSTWRIINSPIHYQNRLRCSDHEALFLAAGFDICERRLQGPSAEDEQTLAGIQLARRFTGYETDDLGVRAATFVARA